MWLMTPRGFYSAVMKPWDRDQGTITVRTRVRADLESLPEVPGHPAPSSFDIATDELADYPFRVRMPRAQWALMVSAMVEEIDYDNFKSEVTRRQGGQRHDVYLDVWRALRRLQTRRPSYGWTSYSGGDPWGEVSPPAPPKRKRKGKKRKRQRATQPSLFGPTPAELASIEAEDRYGEGDFDLPPEDSVPWVHPPF